MLRAPARVGKCRRRCSCQNPFDLRQRRKAAAPHGRTGSRLRIILLHCDSNYNLSRSARRAAAKRAGRAPVPGQAALLRRSPGQAAGGTAIKSIALFPVFSSRTPPCAGTGGRPPVRLQTNPGLPGERAAWGCEGGRESPCTVNICKNRNIFQYFGFCCSICRRFVDRLRPFQKSFTISAISSGVSQKPRWIHASSRPNSP